MRTATKFDTFVNEMPRLFDSLERSPLLAREKLTNIPQKGVYVFYEKSKPLYVGRSDSLKKRIQRHSRPSAPHYSASFAFRLMKEDHNYKNVYRTRKAMVEKNRQPFKNAKRRISQMGVRAIGIYDPVKQALFEIYAALGLNTKYNDFDTH